MLDECRRVVDAFVAEQGTEAVDLIAPAHEVGEVVVADLVSQVPDEGSERLAELAPELVPVSFVGLAQIECDEAPIVPGDGGCAGHMDEVERQSLRRRR